MHLRDLQIMVVDDDPFALKLIGRMLENLGCSRIHAYESASEAEQCIASSAASPEVILLDLNMPGMDGVAFVNRLTRLEYRGGLIPVSGEGERMLRSVKKLANAHGMDVLGHLQKPVDPGKLGRLLTSYRPAPSKPRQRAARNSYSKDDLLQAIEHEQLVNFYQPKVNVATGAVEGVETLVRWQHPSDGLVFPNDFVGLAEEHGLIDALTRTVIRQAIVQARSWHDRSLPLNVAINLSMDNLDSLDLVEFMVETVAQAAVPPEKVILEVTESRLMRNVRSALEVLTRLRLNRFCLSIDDFGTGHSSLQQVLDIPFQQLKIDRGFVHGVSEDATLRAIFNANLQLARELDMEVVAEGVELRQDYEMLRQAGCDLAQGYFVAKPMRPDDIPAWIEHWREHQPINAA